jgi:uncharacterized protein YebE (UPF0316 family)
MLESIFSCLIVCFAKILEISVQSVKTVFMVKGQRIQAAFLGFLECVIWGLVIASIIDTLGDNYLMLFFYCLGYSTGMYIGSVLENKIALGTSSIQLMVKSDKVEKVIEYLNNSNRGFTVLDGKGSKEAMSVVMIVLPRKEVKAVISDIRKLCDKEVFVVSSEVSKFVGGYGIKK